MTGGGSSPAPRPRVLIADDHVPTRFAVRSVLEHEGFDVCAEAPNSHVATDAALRQRPDICLLDLDMPGGGIAAAATITSRLPETAVVMLTVSHARSDVCEAVRAGARGYVLKDAGPAHLTEALRLVLRGERVLPPCGG